MTESATSFATQADGTAEGTYNLNDGNMNEGPERTPDSMPDVASIIAPAIHSTLNWVGMSQIAVPMNISDTKHSDQRVNAKAQIYVDLGDPHAKGIHMSRLYLLLEKFGEQGSVDANSLQKLLNDMLESHEGLSSNATLELTFEYMLNQPALKSDNSGWKSYPVKLTATNIGGQTDVALSVTVPYSSTCPCSAALARQIIQEAFSSEFGNKQHVDVAEVEQWLRSENGTTATPHSQRSEAQVKVTLGDSQNALPISELISHIEGALKTPVQTAVKRADEQEFARLNGQNLMFCEDASRRLKAMLNQQEEQFSDFWLRVDHYESLHAHDATAIATKGIKGGFIAKL